MRSKEGNATRVCFIAPYSDIADSRKGYSIALGSLCASLHEGMYMPFVFDYSMCRSWEKFKDSFRGYERWFSIFCVQVFTDTLECGRRIADYLRARQPGATIVVGGPHVNCVQPSRARAQFQSADYIMRGSAERSLLRVLSGREARTDNEKPIVVADNVAPGSVLAVPRLQNYFFYSSTESHMCRLKPSSTSMNIITSLGCSNNCTYCGVENGHGRKRVSAVRQDVLRSWIEEADSNTRVVTFLDSSPLSDFPRFCEVLRLLRARVHDAQVQIFAHPLQVLSLNTRLGNLRDLGVSHIELGVENLDVRRLKKLNREYSDMDILKAVRLLDIHGFSLKLDFIMFFPDSTLGEIEWNLVQMKEHYLPYLSLDNLMMRLCLYPGTKEYKRFLNRHGLQDQGEIVDYDFDDSVVGRYYTLAVSSVAGRRSHSSNNDVTPKLIDELLELLQEVDA